MPRDFPNIEHDELVCSVTSCRRCSWGCFSCHFVGSRWPCYSCQHLYCCYHITRIADYIQEVWDIQITDPVPITLQLRWYCIQCVEITVYTLRLISRAEARILRDSWGQYSEIAIEDAGEFGEGNGSITTPTFGRDEIGSATEWERFYRNRATSRSRSGERAGGSRRERNL